MPGSATIVGPAAYCVTRNNAISAITAVLPISSRCVTLSLPR
jgi:hypothetical protein